MVYSAVKVFTFSPADGRAPERRLGHYAMLGSKTPSWQGQEEEKVRVRVSLKQLQVGEPWATIAQRATQGENSMEERRST